MQLSGNLYDAAMASVKNLMREKLPKVIFLEKPGDLPRWIENVKKAVEPMLYANWRASIKVGGKIYQEMVEKNPNHPGVQKMKRYAMESRRAIPVAKPHSSTASSAAPLAATAFNTNQ